MRIDDNYIGGKLRNIREKHNMTQKQLAREINVTQQSISRYESGKTHIPYADLQKITELYDVSMGYFFEYTTEEITDEEYLLISCYRKIDRKVRMQVYNVLLSLSDCFSKEDDFEE